MLIKNVAAAALVSSVLVLGGATPALASSGDVETGRDVVIGGGKCSEKDVIIIAPNPVNDDVYRVCFDWPV